MALLLCDYADALPDTSDWLNQKLKQKFARLRISTITLLIVSVIATDVKPVEVRIETGKIPLVNLASGNLATVGLLSPEYIRDISMLI